MRKLSTEWPDVLPACILSQVFSSPYLERRRLVKSVCGRILHDDGGDDDDGGYYRSQLDRYKRPIDKTVMFDPGHNLTYCWVHKVNKENVY